VRLGSTRTVGSNHLKGVLRAGGRGIDTIAFGWADRSAAYVDGAVDVAFRLEQNEWNGRTSLQARAVSLAPAGR
jgi:hypothetical protein